MPGKGARHTVELAQRRHLAAQMYLHGTAQWEIARELKVSQQVICIDIRIIREMWLASMLRDFDAAKAQELAKVDAVEVEHWSAWKRSQKAHETTLTEKTIAEDGKATPRRATVRRENQYGDPRFLDGVMRCIERRCAILGLDAPTKFRVAWDKMTEQQLERLAAGESPQQVLSEEMADA